MHVLVKSVRRPFADDNQVPAVRTIHGRTVDFGHACDVWQKERLLALWALKAYHHFVHLNPFKKLPELDLNQ